jgi:hypothetical protein
MNSLVASIGRMALATTRPLTASLNSRHSLSTTSFKSSLFSPTTTTTPVAKTIQNGIICPSQSWASPSLLLGCVGMSSMLISQMQVRYRRVYITRSRRFPGHVDVYGEEDGKREALKAAEDRYKRLDWGIYIRTRYSLFLLEEFHISYLGNYFNFLHVRNVTTFVQPIRFRLIK